MISDICLKALTVQYELWYLENLYQQALSVQPELCYLCQHALTIHYNLWYLISVNRLSQYSINYHWYLNLSTGTHSTADSSTHRNGHGPDSTVSVDETTTDSGIHAPGFAPEMSQVDENSQGEEEGKWWYL